MNEILIGLLASVFMMFIVGTIFGWVIQRIQHKQNYENMRSIEDIYRRIDEEVGILNNSIDEKVRDLYDGINSDKIDLDIELNSIKSMIDSRLDKLENKITKK